MTKKKTDDSKYFVLYREDDMADWMLWDNADEGMSKESAEVCIREWFSEDSQHEAVAIKGHVVAQSVESSHVVSKVTLR